MNPETGVLLQSMPSWDSMDMGKGYDDMIGCAICSLSQCLMKKVLLPCFILVVSVMGRLGYEQFLFSFSFIF